MTKRRKLKKHRGAVYPWDAERWFQFVEAFDPAKTRKLRLANSFYRGKLKDLVIIEVSRTASDEAVVQLRDQLAEEGIRALIVSDNVRFMKLKMCSPEMEKVLDEASAGNGDGLVKDSNGGCGSDDDGRAEVLGDDQAQDDSVSQGEDGVRT